MSSIIKTVLLLFICLAFTYSAKLNLSNKTNVACDKKCKATACKKYKTKDDCYAAKDVRCGWWPFAAKCYPWD